MNWDIFLLPFMQRALLGGILVAVVTSTVGVFAVLRRTSFFGDTIAHASLAGVALALLLGLNPILTALAFSIGISVSLPTLEKRSALNIDALLGFILPFSMALSILLLSFIPGYQPELFSLLFGSILSISATNLAIIGILAIITLGVVIKYRAKLLASAFDPTYAHITGIKVGVFAILHNVLMSLAIVPSISLVGVILVTALLTIPAATARQFTTTLQGMFMLTPLIAVVTTLLGLVLSVALQMASGPLIVVVLGTVFLLSTGYASVRK